jgi:hypothetical protein
MKEQGYEPASIRMAEQLNKQRQDFGALQSQLSQQQAYYAQLENERTIDSFHVEVDRLGIDDLFGKSDPNAKLPNKAFKNREKVYNEAAALAQGYQATGRQIPPLEVLVQRAAQLAFGSELSARANQQKLEKIAEQSKRRRPVGTAVSTAQANKNTPSADPHSAEAILRRPELQKWRRDIEERTGRRV